MKNKGVILLFAFFFGLVSPLLLTESVISNLNDIRRNYILSQKQTIKTIQVETLKWNKLTDKKEIFYQNDFYDVKKVVQNNHKTTLTLVKDSFENFIKLSTNKKASKKEKSIKQSSQYASFDVLTNQKNFFISIQVKSISNEISSNFNSSYLFKLKKPPIS